MLNSIIRFSLRHRSVVFVLAAVLVVQGMYALTRAPFDVFPEFAPPVTMIQTEAPGLSSEQVEVLITQPIERAVGGVSGIQSLRSKSLQGLSAVTVIFSDSTDILQARQLVSERLAVLRNSLPAGAHAPAMLPLTSTTSTVLMAGLSSKSRTLMEVHDTALWLLKPQLLAVHGVAEVVIFGGDIRQLQIQVDPAKLQRYELSIQDVLAAAHGATGVRGAGFIENQNQRITLQTEGQAGTPEALAKVVLRWLDGNSVRLGDVATVSYGAAPSMGAASVRGQPGVVLVLQSQYGANTKEVTAGVERVLDNLRPELIRLDMDLHKDIFRPADFIDRATDHLGIVLMTGAALVVLVLCFFLMNMRAALISATAIPLSLLAACIVLKALGMTLNTMTLGGLAIALGEVVDDAIIDVENIYRRLRENRALITPMPPWRVVLRASLEVRSAVVYATFIVILVFVPVMSMSGVAGKLFGPLGIAYALAVAASLAVALTLTPALSLALLDTHTAQSLEPVWMQKLKARYVKLLYRIDQHHRRLIYFVCTLSLVGAGALPFLHGSFIPVLHEGHFIAHIGLAPGTSLHETMRVGTQISQALMRLPGVRMVAQTAGRASEVVDPAGVQLSEIEISLNRMDAGEQDAILNRIRRLLSQFPGITASVNTFLIERIDETISGSTAPVVVNVFGPSLDVIEHASQQIAQWLGTLQGAANVHVDSSAGMPVWSIRLKHEELSLWGLRPVDVLDAIEAACQGSTVAQAYSGSQVIDVTVMLAASARGCNDPVNSCSGDNTERKSREHGHGRRSQAMDGEAQSSAGHRNHSM